MEVNVLWYEEREGINEHRNSSFEISFKGWHKCWTRTAHIKDFKVKEWALKIVILCVVIKERE